MCVISGIDKKVKISYSEISRQSYKKKMTYANCMPIFLFFFAKK